MASKEMVEWMEEKRIPWWQEYSLIAYVQVLKAKGYYEEADNYLQKAYERVMMVASKTEDENLRQSWLKNGPWNREIVREAKAPGLVSI